ncbi:MAG: hypothetical protein M1404_00640 [Acidobacteria bacterium]|nr:hypothetical protein [Acidobacteriota bacterium]
MSKRVAEENEKKVKEAAASARPQPSAGNLFGLCLAAWLVPGLGHLLLGRKWRAVILFASIVGMFVVGIAMQGQYFYLGSGSYLHTLGYFAELAVGIPMRAATFFGYGGGDTYFVCSDYGTAYLISAGMLNVLTVLDAYDIALGRKP